MVLKPPRSLLLSSRPFACFDTLRNPNPSSDERKKIASTSPNFSIWSRFCQVGPSPHLFIGLPPLLFAFWSPQLRSDFYQPPALRFRTGLILKDFLLFSTYGSPMTDQDRNASAFYVVACFRQLIQTIEFPVSQMI